MTINGVKTILDAMNRDFKRLLINTGIQEYGEFSSEITKSLSNADDNFLATELFSVMLHIEAANSSLDYLSRRITGEYTLYKNSRGRYECEIREYTSGNTIEYYTYDDYDDCYKWIKSRVEYDSELGDYYIVGAPGLSLEGLKIRVRASH